MILSVRNVNFGVGKTGLATVGYRLVNANGTIALARTTTGVVEVLAGTGIYQAEISFPENWSGTILWDTGEGSPKYAADPFDVRSIDTSTRFPSVAPGGVEKQTWSAKDKKQNFEILNKIMEVLAEIKTLHAEHSAILNGISTNIMGKKEMAPVMEGIMNSVKSVQESQREIMNIAETLIESQALILENQEVEEILQEVPDVEN